MSRFSPTASAFLMLMLAGLTPAASSAGIPSFPSEATTLAKIAEDIRIPLSDKMGEMRMTYSVREIPSGSDNAKIEFLGTSDTVVASVTLRRSLNPEKTERMEDVRLTNSNGATVFRETILTRGNELTFSDATKRIFFEAGSSDYALKSNEQSKIVSVTMDGAEPFRFVSMRTGAVVESSNVSADLYFGGAKILTISDSLSGDKSLRSLRYTMHGRGFQLKAFRAYSNASGGGWPTFSMQMDSRRPPGYVLDNVRYYYEGKEIYGINFFIKLFGNDMYGFLVTQCANRFLSAVLNSQLPATQRVANIGQSDRFQRDLDYIKAQLTNAVATSNMTLISTAVTPMINDFIAALQNGTLKVTDTRPEQK